MNLSAVILTKNEARNIKDCIEALSFCDEIVVIDDYSDDGTVRIAKKLGAIVYKRLLNNDFADQRNYGLSKARGKWVLFVDADERVPEALASEITNYKLQISNEIVGLKIKRQDYMWGKALRHGETASVKLLRLAKRSSGKWVRSVHENWEIEGKTYTLSHPIFHYPHPTLREFIADINTFSTLHAQANKEEGKKSNLIKIIIFPIAKFLHNYFVRLGFLDGIQGFMMASVMSFHSFLAWSKLWFSQN